MAFETDNSDGAGGFQEAWDDYEVAADLLAAEEGAPTPRILAELEELEGVLVRKAVA